MASTDRRRFLEYFQHEMDAIDAQLDQWRAETRGPGGKPVQPETIRELEQRRDDVRRRSMELEDFNGDSWDEARKDVERAHHELKRSIDDAKGDAPH